MEDYEEQEVEFWRKLAEEDISRGTMLRRSAAAAFGLTGPRGGRARRLQRPAPGRAAPPSFGSAKHYARELIAGRRRKATQHHRAAARLGELWRDDG